MAAKLDIPFYAVDAKEDIPLDRGAGFSGWLRARATPNPCLTCNRAIKWEFLLKHALAAGADHLATGHYARRQTDERGRIQLLRA